MKNLVMMEWDGSTSSEYDQLMKILNMRENPPKGGILHLVGYSNNVGRVSDVWASEQDFGNFIQSRVMPTMAQLGSQSQPQVKIIPIYDIFVVQNQSLSSANGKVALQMIWDGFSKEQYEQVNSIMNFKGNPPKGLNMHIHAFDGNTSYVTDVWDSAEEFNHFLQTRIIPAMEQIGVTYTSQLSELFPIYAIALLDAQALVSTPAHH